MPDQHHDPPPTAPGRVHRLLAGLQNESVAGMLLLGAALLALVWANSPWREAYHALGGLTFGPEALHLRLDLTTWAADGLLAVFFLVVGLELKTELVTGSLRRPAEAAMPMLAAVLGMVAPAAVYLLVQTATGSGATQGWAIPTATDIAFAVALLGIFGRGLPPAARVFLLTLAVVDDLLAIIVIALFYTETIAFGPLLGALAAVAVFAAVVQRRVTAWWVLVPLGLVAWALMHASGVHATVAGVVLGLVVPARPGPDGRSLTHDLVGRVQPVSAGFALPVFAFFAAGVTVAGTGLGAALSDPVAVGVVAGLVLGKPLGIWGGVAILTRITPLRLGHGLHLPDLLGVSMLAGIGFTVSLLIASLSFGADADGARLAVLVGSLVSALLGAVTLRLRARAIIRGARAR